MANSILLEVVNNALRSVAEQMTVTMVRSSYSTIVKEMMDCSSAIFDDKGRMLSEGANVPIHLNCLGPCLNTVLTKFFSREQLNPGDIILTNQTLNEVGGGNDAVKSAVLIEHDSERFLVLTHVLEKNVSLNRFGNEVSRGNDSSHNVLTALVLKSEVSASVKNTDYIINAISVDGVA